MKIEKNWLCNRIDDRRMNNSLVVHIEKEVFDKVENDVVMRNSQIRKTHREQLNFFYCFIVIIYFFVSKIVSS